jgi:hypothetical protein
MKIAVIGGGASGLMAAIAAAKNGAQVSVYEKMNRVGKKILATGNGRCNYTNMNLSKECYHSNDLSLTDEVMNFFGLDKTLSFFEDLGIFPYVDEKGKVYPNSLQASSILDVLRYELKRLKVDEITDFKVTALRKNKGKFSIIGSDTADADRVILATGGIGEMTVLTAVEAGIDIVDTAISPLSSGTSQPATESLCLALRGTERDPGLNLDSLNNIADYFKDVMKKYEENGTLNIKVLMTEPKALIYQIPGGMLSNLLVQMKSLNAVDKFQEVLDEVPRVRKDLGYPPLVTPMSQMVGAQAVFNVISGGRYNIIPTEIRNYVRGMYGRPAAPISDDIKELIIGNEEVITVRPADLLEDSYDRLREEIGYLAKSEQDVLSYALFPQVAKSFFEKRDSGDVPCCHTASSNRTL